MTAATDPVFTGVGVALVTLFDDRGALDPSATAEHATRCVEAGVRAVVVAGSTGEAAALERSERIEVLDAVVDAVRPLGGVVVAGTGAPSARQATVLTRDAADHGADAALVLSPPLTPDPRPYYEQVAGSVDIPVLAYHYPAVSPPGIRVEHLPDLPVAGCKDSSGDADRLLETIERWPGHLYTGSSAIVSFAGALGITGAILALANVEPERCVAAFSGDHEAQRSLARVHVAMSRGRFPHAIKQLTAGRYGTSTVTRMG